jgi:hypothetical protein
VIEAFQFGVVLQNIQRGTIGFPKITEPGSDFSTISTSLEHGKEKDGKKEQRDETKKRARDNERETNFVVFTRDGLQHQRLGGLEIQLVAIGNADIADDLDVFDLTDSFNSFLFGQLKVVLEDGFDRTDVGLKKQGNNENEKRDEKRERKQTHLVTQVTIVDKSILNRFTSIDSHLDQSAKQTTNIGN